MDKKKDKLQAAQSTRFKTDADLKKFKPQDKKTYVVSDVLRKGLRLRVHPTGRMTWIYEYNRPVDLGAPPRARIELGTYPTVPLAAARDKRDALAVMRNDATQPDPYEYLQQQQRERSSRKVQDKARSAAEAWTVRALGKEFLATLGREGKRPRTIGEIKRQLEKDIYPVIGDAPGHEVTAEDVRDVLMRIEKRGAMRLRNAVRVTLRWLYTWAADEGPVHLRHHPNPVAGTRRKKDGDRPKRQRRPFTDTELRALWPRLVAHRGDVYADALALALLCGTRADETVSARWRDVDLKAGTWTVPETVTKSRRRHPIFLSEPALAVMEARKSAGGGEWAFPLKRSKKLGHARPDTLRKRLAAHMAALELDTEMTVHEMRHTVCTFVERRWGAGARQRVANHAPEGLSAVYNHHSYDEEAREAWNRWGAYLDGLASGAKVVELRPGFVA